MQQTKLLWYRLVVQWFLPQLKYNSNQEVFIEIRVQQPKMRHMFTRDSTQVLPP